MKVDRAGRELSVPHLILGAAVAGVTAAVAGRFLLQPLLGLETGDAVANFLTWFLLGYLALAVGPPGQPPPPLFSLIRLRSGLIFGVVGGLAMLAVDRLWP